MSVQKMRCPECRVGLKSADGFVPGQAVRCPKCESDFVVSEPEDERPKPARKAVRAAVADDDDGEDEKPRKKKKKRVIDEDADERSYKNSPLRYAILAVLVLVMLVLGFFLYQKKKREREADAALATPAGADPESAPVRPNTAQPKGPAPRPQPGAPKRTAGVPVPAAGALVDGLLVGAVPAAEARKLLAKYTAALRGSWAADLGGGAAERLAYADGTFTAARTGPGAATASGTYAVKGLVGTRGLRLQLDTAAGPRTVVVTFEGDELHHPSFEPGVTATFRKG